ncbi:MAG: hypothetical protein JOZ31_18320 [Verrucomicrobia bacterium]|nr:hypothetical protein [Verrucomicrobiota bacterium]
MISLVAARAGTALWCTAIAFAPVSVGLVFDQRLVQWPQAEGKLGDRLKAFLMQHPVAREMVAEAQYDQNDVHWRKNLAYYSTTFAGDGFVLAGDAAAFMDPFYNPGMDWISFTTTGAAELIAAQRRGEPMAERIERHNRDFSLCYHSWFESVYKDKYEYMGEWDLMSIAVRLDLGLYYLGVVSQPFKFGAEALKSPPFTSPRSRLVFSFIRAYNRRFAAIARSRRNARTLGRANRGQRCLIPGFTLKWTDLRLLVRPVAQWAWIEMTEGWRSWRQPPREKTSINAAANTPA